VFPDARVVVELDGWAYHVTRDRFHHDRERQNRLIGAGWIVLRFTWRDLSERPGYVTATIRAVLAGRSRNQW
jgi:very-short-patch-repair endonuclease